MITNSSELLDQLLIGKNLTVDEIDVLLSKQVKEDQYLEYKHGNILKDNDVNQIVRKFITGFSNSAGGVLIIGIDAPNALPISITGCDNHEKGPLDEWISRCLTPIASYFSPLPIIQVINHPKGDILIAATPRSAGLVPTIAGGVISYYFRFHDQTLDAPDYLVADILLGRRQKPVLKLTWLSITNLKCVQDKSFSTADITFDLRWRMENESIVWADSSMWGIIAWVKEWERPSSPINTPSEHLLQFIDMREINKTNYENKFQLIHTFDEAHIEKPFDNQHKYVPIRIPLRVGETWYRYVWKSAFYLISKNSEPIWYQFSVNVSRDLIEIIDHKKTIDESSGIYSIQKVIGNRAIVDWEGI